MQQQLTERSTTCVGAECFTLLSHQIGKHWPAILRLLNRIEDADWTSDQVYEDLISARAQLWGIAANGEIQGIWITRIEKTPRDLYGLVWIAAGDGLEVGLYHFLNMTEEWFKEKGCRYVEVSGRKGWQKVLPNYEFRAVQLRKYL
jgi:hypothetical protein